MKTDPQNQYSDFEEINENYDWKQPHPRLGYSIDNCVVKIDNFEFRVKQKTVNALDIVAGNLRFQKDSKILPTGKELYYGSGLEEDRAKNIKRNEKNSLREFRVFKDLFYLPELKVLIKYDKRKNGYYLNLD